MRTNLRPLDASPPGAVAGLARRAGPSRPRRHLLLAVMIGALGVLAALLVPRPALAVGTVTLATREPVEADGRWKLAMTIDYGSIPQIPHVPVIFSFQPMVLYERALLDKTGDKPQLVRMPLSNQQSINEGMDIGFADASGKVFKVTKFDFVIKRDHGFEAGEYDLKIKREDDGVQIGQTIHLILKGDNPVIDRRAITFAGEKPKKKGDEKKADAPEEKKADEEKKPSEGEDKKPEGDEGATPPPVEKKQGGCGCRVPGAGDPGTGSVGALLALALAGFAVARRRR
jgi:MYXO-CTERM domain-containing protein